ncbi:MAG TPA: glycosyltransferase family 4 protein [Candidatus Eisenbacteria bacterium]|nr:glycosyltransferase family 4 protein [Candidatus Eisenbacteria bacterium]
MKLLVISAALPPMPAGEADHTFHLCRRLSQRGIDVQVLTTAVSNIPRGLPFTVHPVMKNWSWSDLPRFAGFLRRCRPDAVLLFYSDWIYHRHPMITFAPLVAKAIFPGIPFVTQLEIHKASINATPATRAFMKGLSVCSRNRIDYVLGGLVAWSDRLVVLSEVHRNELMQQHSVAAGKASVIPPPPLIQMAPLNGDSRNRGRAALKLSPDDFVLAYIGYIYSAKGVDILFKAYHELKKRHPRLRLLMIGGDLAACNTRSYTDTLPRLIEELDIANEITWTGSYEWNTNEASLYLQAADVCVFPFKDGVKLNRSTVAAAAAHGLPIVTTASTTLEPPFLNGVNMLLCRPNDVESITAAIESLIDSPDLRGRLSQGARQLAHDWFSWDKAVDRTIEALGIYRRTAEPAEEEVFTTECDMSLRSPPDNENRPHPKPSPDGRGN